MNNKSIAIFTANGVVFQLIAHNDGRDGYTVFTQVLGGGDLNEADCYNKKEHAIARFLFLTNRILLEAQ